MIEGLCKQKESKIIVIKKKKKKDKSQNLVWTLYIANTSYIGTRSVNVNKAQSLETANKQSMFSKTERNLMCSIKISLNYFLENYN